MGPPAFSLAPARRRRGDGAVRGRCTRRSSWACRAPRGARGRRRLDDHHRDAPAGRAGAALPAVPPAPRVPRPRRAATQCAWRGDRRPRQSPRRRPTTRPADDCPRAARARDAPEPPDFMAPNACRWPRPETPLSELVALAAPTAAIARARERAPAPLTAQFPVEGLPAHLSIDYRLTSALADGRAAYRWSRDGDAYRITGEARGGGILLALPRGAHPAGEPRHRDPRGPAARSLRRA